MLFAFTPIFISFAFFTAIFTSSKNKSSERHIFALRILEWTGEESGKDTEQASKYYNFYEAIRTFLIDLIVCFHYVLPFRFIIDYKLYTFFSPFGLPSNIS